MKTLTTLLCFCVTVVSIASLQAAPSWARRGSELAGRKCGDCGFHTRCSKCGLTWFHGPCSCSSGGGRVPPAVDICLDCEEKAAARAALEEKRKELQGRAEEIRRQLASLDATGRSSELAMKVGKARSLLSRIRFDRDLNPAEKSSLIAKAELKIAELEGASGDYQAKRAQLMQQLNEIESQSMNVLSEMATSQ